MWYNKLSVFKYKRKEFFIVDIFGEQLIRRETSGADWAKRIALTVGGLALSSVSMFFALATGLSILLFLSVGILFGLVWILTGMNYEYEYILTNDDFDFDKITGKRKRNRLITIKFNTVEEFGVYDGSQGNNVNATVVATDNTGTGIYYIIAKHKTHGMTMVLFTPNERMVGLVLQALPRKVKAETKVKIEEKPQSSEE